MKTQLTFTQFTDKIVSEIKNYLPAKYTDADISIQHNIKPGNQFLTGICIHMPDSSIAPVLYLDDLYSGYCRGDESIQDVLGILSDQVQQEIPVSFDPQMYMEWENVKSRIVSRLINVGDGQNDAYLASHPATIFDGSDIGIIYDVDLSDIGEGMSIPVTAALMERWEATVEDLDLAARSNNPRLHPLRIQSLCSLINDLEPMADIPDADTFPMITVTNENCWNGAITVTYDGVEERLQELLGGPVYLLPSSVHEMMAVRQEMMDPEELSLIIQSINSEQVKPCEVLGSHPYVLRNSHLVPVLGTDTSGQSVPYCTAEPVLV